MALAGSLKEFGLADILQLIHYQRKSGALTIQSRLDKVKLLFHDGNIVYAETKRRDIENRLGRVLVKRGLVKADDVKSAVEEQKRTGARLGAVLIKKRLISQEQLQEVLTFQITETAVQLFSWKEGRYEFKPEAIPVDKDIALNISTQHLLMEGLRLLDEWSLIEGRITIDSIFEKRAGAPDAELEREESAVLECVDGKTDVVGISDLCGLDSFQVSNALLSLLDKGLVMPKEAEGEAGAAERPLPVAAKKSTGGLRVIVTALSAGAFALSLLAYIVSGTKLDAFKAYEDIYSLRFKIEAEKREKGAYPASVSETDRWGSPYVYELKESGFTLVSPGPDKTPGTGDDIY